MRSWLPDPIGGVLWFGVDDTYSTVYFPAYAGVTGVPHSYAEGTGSYHEVDFDAAFWVFNQVANFAYLRYQDMIEDIQRVQQHLEGRFLGEVPEVDAAAQKLYERSPRLAKDYLTRYSRQAGNDVVDRWRELSKELLYKYMDGNVKNEFGEPEFKGYPEPWYRMVAEATGDKLAMKKTPTEAAMEREAEAKARKLAESVLTILESRGVAVGPELRSRVLDNRDVEELREWLLAAASGESVSDMMDAGGE
jgi:hypothetical protein